MAIRLTGLPSERCASRICYDPAVGALRAILFALVTFSTFACGGDDPQPQPLSCNATTCSGCCQGNYCIESPTDSACGAAGQACFSCSLGTTCLNGRCEFPAGNCQQSCSTGCCESGLCQLGTNHDACGNYGQTCTNCSLLGQSCDPVTRVCTDQSNPACNSENCPGCCNGTLCEDGTTTTRCGTGGLSCQACSGEAICQAGQCVVPDKKVDIVLDRVVIAAPWVVCVETECDPWLILTYAGQPYESSHKAGNDVLFDEVLVPSVSAKDLKASGFEIDLYEEDWTGSSWLCDAIVRVSDWDLSQGEIVVDCTDYLADYVSMADVRIKFVPVTP